MAIACKIDEEFISHEMLMKVLEKYFKDILSKPVRRII